jgi:hypothetical protein
MTRCQEIDGVELNNYLLQGGDKEEAVCINTLNPADLMTPSLCNKVRGAVLSVPYFYNPVEHVVMASHQ